MKSPRIAFQVKDEPLPQACKYRARTGEVYQLLAIKFNHAPQVFVKKKKDYLDHATTLRCTEKREESDWVIFDIQRKSNSPGMGRTLLS